MGNIPVALVSGAVTAGIIKTDFLDGEEWQVVKIDLGAASASNPLVGGQRDSENSISIVGASGALFSVAASVRGNVAASVAGTVVVAVSAGQVAVTNQIDASVHGLVSAGGHVLVSVDGTLNTGGASAGVTANGLGSLIMGVDTASAAQFLKTDTVGRLAVAVSGGQIVVSNTVDVSSRQIDVSAHGVVDVSSRQIDVSAHGVVDVSSRQIDVSAHGIVSAGGHVLVSGDGSFVTLGNVAHDGVDAGAPVKLGGYAVVSALPPAVASGDRVNGLFDKFGRQVVSFHPREAVVQAQATVESAANRTIMASGGAGIFRDIAHLVITNEAATAMTMYLFDGSAAGAARAIYAIAAGGGAVVPYPIPLKQLTPDRVWSVTINPSVAAFQYVNIQAVENT